MILRFHKLVFRFNRKRSDVFMFLFSSLLLLHFSFSSFRSILSAVNTQWWMAPEIVKGHNQLCVSPPPPPAAARESFCSRLRFRKNSRLSFPSAGHESHEKVKGLISDFTYNNTWEQCTDHNISSVHGARTPPTAPEPPPNQSCSARWRFFSVQSRKTQLLVSLNPPIMASRLKVVFPWNVMKLWNVSMFQDFKSPVYLQFVSWMNENVHPHLLVCLRKAFNSEFPCAACVRVTVVVSFWFKPFNTRAPSVGFSTLLVLKGCQENCQFPVL